MKDVINECNYLGFSWCKVHQLSVPRLGGDRLFDLQMVFPQSDEILRPQHHATSQVLEEKVREIV